MESKTQFVTLHSPKLSKQGYVADLSPFDSMSSLLDYLDYMAEEKDWFTDDHAIQLREAWFADLVNTVDSVIVLSAMEKPPLATSRS